MGRGFALQAPSGAFSCRNVCRRREREVPPSSCLARGPRPLFSSDRWRSSEIWSCARIASLHYCRYLIDYLQSTCSMYRTIQCRSSAWVRRKEDWQDDDLVQSLRKLLYKHKQNKVIGGAVISACGPIMKQHQSRLLGDSRWWGTTLDTVETFQPLSENEVLLVAVERQANAKFGGTVRTMLGSQEEGKMRDERW